MLITRIDSDSSLSGTDVRVNDIITAVNGVDISSMEDMIVELDKYKPDDRITVSVYRKNKESKDGKKFDVSVTLKADKD